MKIVKDQERLNALNMDSLFIPKKHKKEFYVIGHNSQKAYRKCDTWSDAVWYADAYQMRKLYN